MPEASLKPSHPAKCDACDQVMDSPAVCRHCQTLHPVDSVDYFTLLGLDADYDVDIDEVRRRYLNLARAVHPDRLGVGTPEVELLSLRTSAQLNDAKRVLLDPILRADYMLAVAGGSSSAADKQVPPEVLAETLTLREELADARAENDHDALTALNERIRSSYDQWLEQIAHHARRLPGDQALRSALRAALNAISYYRRMLDEL